MSIDGASLAIAASQFIGTPFRLHGRDPRRGLDCVGLLVVSMRAIGAEVSDPSGYGLRNRSIDSHLEKFRLSSFVSASGEMESGDILVVRPGPGQHHILICHGRSGFVHAHAGLGRVVRSSGPSPWQVWRHYRLSISNRG